METGDMHRLDNEQGPSTNLLDLPSEIIEKILRHTNFATISNTRMVCHHLNNAASGLLNSEFVRLRCFHATTLPSHQGTDAATRVGAAQAPTVTRVRHH
ncbi:hypothetical protein HPB50_016265 [Hyalomma asiaticum]|uniref:Uncharacterized protein n=1 Tax=Hyalomma asiaticum TaxID=266040 RepID=A0ACB7S9C7_HYAAI|nr:hypothetical protein HPB50_016265 [Hyalomma asiaticum]